MAAVRCLSSWQTGMCSHQAVAADDPAASRAVFPACGLSRSHCFSSRGIGWRSCRRLGSRSPLSPLPLHPHGRPPRTRAQRECVDHRGQLAHVARAVRDGYPAATHNPSAALHGALLRVATSESPLDASSVYDLRPQAALAGTSHAAARAQQVVHPEFPARSARRRARLPLQEPHQNPRNAQKLRRFCLAYFQRLLLFPLVHLDARRVEHPHPAHQSVHAAVSFARVADDAAAILDRVSIIAFALVASVVLFALFVWCLLINMPPVNTLYEWLSYRYLHGLSLINSSASWLGCGYPADTRSAP